MAPLGFGIYPMADAALLTQCDVRTIQCWLERQNPTVVHNAIHVPAINQCHIRHRDAGCSEITIGFQELLELRVVREFVRWGIPLSIIRQLWLANAAALGVRHPFSTREFMLRGIGTFRDALASCADTGNPAHHSKLLGTRSFRRIIPRSLFAGIEHVDGKATRWYPLPRIRAVVVDPAIQFGHPVLADSGIPTASLYATYLAEGRRESVVARLFEVSPKDVEWAVAFEQKLRGAVHGSPRCLG